MRYIERQISSELISLANSFPVVSIIGPRQSGKTTLVRHIFSHKEYVTLEDPDIREFAEEDPRAFLNKFPNGAILDEIQRLPKLLSYIQGIVDNSNTNGMWILTGSNQILLHSKINQSLAGRTAIVKLLPLSMAELSNSDINLDINEYLFNGFYPRIYSNNINPYRLYSNYYSTYVEKDIRQIINLKDATLFQKFMKLCAGRVGQLFNASQLANEVGVSVPTIKSWLSILETSFIIFMLPPWYDKISKRLIKSPKLYFYDVGLATHLLGIRNTRHIETHPLRGNIFENLVIGELVKKFYNHGVNPDIYFYRDNHGNEVDVIIPDGDKIIPIEIKSSQTYHSSFSKGINYIKQLLTERVNKSYIIYSGEWQQEINSTKLINYKSIYNEIEVSGDF